jgi:predicted transcriptional regulator
LDDRTLAVVLHQRFAVPQRTIAALLGVTQQTIHKAIGQTDQLLALTGHQPEPAGTRLRTVSDLLTHAATAGITTPAEIKTAC